jgi:hypothetical protein
MNGKEPLKQLAALFDRDHLRLVAILDDAAVLCRAGSYGSGAKVFGEFRHIIERHMAAEERALDTLTREGHCPPRLALEVAEAHEQLGSLIEETWGAMQHDGAAFDTALDSLKRSVAAHERVEQEQLLPALCACYPNRLELDSVVHALL